LYSEFYVQHLLIILSVIILAASTTGCIPRHHVIAPGATGQIVDAETEQPITEAKIEAVNVDKNGQFILSANKKWGLTVPFVGGNYPVSSFFTVTAPGYQTRTCNCETITPNPRCDDLMIPLEKIDRKRDTGTKHFVFAEGEGDPVGDNAFCAPVLTSSHWRTNHPELKIQRLEKDAQNGSSDAAYELGIRYINGDDVEKDTDLGRYMIRQAAEQGNPKAIAFFFNAARQGNPDAQVFVGDLLSLGLGTEQNIPESIDWYEKAAAQNNATGMLRLAEIYASGEIVPADKGKAEKWYQKAAETGSAEAMFECAEAYRYGELGPINLEKSIYWWIKAADAGSMRARDMLMQTIADDDLSPEIKQPAVEWLKK
jgi:hypothetical protein